MGNTPLSNEAIKQLPYIKVLGKLAPLLELQGDYESVEGRVRKNSLLLGAISISDDNMIFVKMIGPEVYAQDQRQAFIKFCTSLKYSIPKTE